ncbi:MAG: hypothetical protein E7645_02705 [Ruminococcaceae bacterium]|nr:hypothetical protein [Oscillospiraceae bacterium]
MKFTLKHTLSLVGLTVWVVLLSACSEIEPPKETVEATLESAVQTQEEGTEEPTEQPTEMPVSTEAPTEAETDPPIPEPLYIVMPENKSSSYTITWDMADGDSLKAEADRICKALENTFNTRFRQTDAAVESRKRATEIVLGSANREECAALTATLAEGEFAVKVYPSAEKGKGRIVIAYTNRLSRTLAVEFFITDCIDKYGGCLPMDFEARGGIPTEEPGIIVSDISKLRDPCILVVDDTYYAYGTNWKLYKNTSKELGGPWKQIKNIVEIPADVDTNKWAPEVHVYNGSYYMFTTYKSKSTGKRGCTIMKSDSPEGPFVEITNGHITPKDWDAIDGTLYVDPEGQPWMVFVHEWTSAKNGIGTFAAAKLSEDFTHFISEPIELFAADEPAWATAQVTDGCWMYTTKEGELLMLWSNFEPAGYTVAIARSSNGRLDGEWIHEGSLLYSENYTGEHDGGHGMIFKDLNGQMYLSMHSPNDDTTDRKATPTFIPLVEKNGTLVWTYIDSARENITVTGSFPEE